MSASAALFSGQPLPFGGLSNEKELAISCPPEFKMNSRWSDFAATLFARQEVDTDVWKWRTASESERFRQTLCLQTLLGSSELSHEDKVAVAGWMLSEMLSEVPQF